MSRSVLTQVDRVVSPDVDRRHLHQRAQTQSAATIVGEHQKAGPERTKTRERHAVHEGTHGVLADSEMEVAPGVAAAVTRRLEIAGALERQQRLGRGPKIGRSAEQPGTSPSDGVLD